MPDTDDPRDDRASLNTDEAVWLSVAVDAPDKIDAYRAAAEKILGVDLVDVPPPHVTLLFVGPVPDGDTADLVAEAGTATAATQPFDLTTTGFGSFPAGSDGRTPILLKIDPTQLKALHHRLMAALAPRITAPQFPSYKAHLTLGYAPPGTEIPPDFLDGTSEKISDTLSKAEAVEVRQGGKDLATLPLGKVTKRAGTTSTTVPICKVDKKRQILTAIVYEPWSGDPADAADQADLQDDVMTAEEIERSMLDFMLNLNRGSRAGFMHEDGEPPFHIVECWCTRAPLTFDRGDGTTQEVRTGTWIVSIFIDDAETWALVESGELDGISFAGAGDSRPV